MSKCPYTNFKDKILKYIGVLRTPRDEYGGMPACPFVGPEIDKGKLMIDMFDPKKITLLEKVKELDESEYDSALFVQVTDEEILGEDTYVYQNFINKTLRTNGYGHLKAICFNPNDTKEVAGFNPRKDAPYFLINIASKKVLGKAHKSLLGTKYFQNFEEEYLKFLKVN
tara:strand:- start:2406 stop:2912 length:507 start_codon:yes stop_codon:yes gene_type:complete